MDVDEGTIQNVNGIADDKEQRKTECTEAAQGYEGFHISSFYFFVIIIGSLNIDLCICEHNIKGKSNVKQN